MPKEVLDTITAVGAVLTPILLLLLGGIGWFIKRSFEKSQAKELSQVTRIRELEDKLREDRIVIYNSLLEPFFILFTTEAAFAQDAKYKGKKKDDLAMSTMLSVEYRRIDFKLSLVASDAVVRSYNRLMQFFYHIEADSSPIETKTSNWIKLLGDLLLEIRKSMGNESTKLDRWEMIEWFMKDAELMKKLSANSSH